MMNLNEMILQRINQLCEHKGISINELAKKSNMSPSTLYSFFDDNRRGIGIVALKKICDGLSMSLEDFFDSKFF